MLFDTIKVKPSSQCEEHAVTWNEKDTEKSTKFAFESWMKIEFEKKAFPFVDAVPLFTISEEPDEVSADPPEREREFKLPPTFIPVGTKGGEKEEKGQARKKKKKTKDRLSHQVSANCMKIGEQRQGRNSTGRWFG